MIPFNVLEQVNSKTLALIHPNRRSAPTVPRARDSAKSQPDRGPASADPRDPCGRPALARRGRRKTRRSGDASCRTAPLDVRAAFRKIARLVQDLAFERERLIGADAIGVRTLGADRKRLGLR